jgi:hypothetical protein
MDTNAKPDKRMAPEGFGLAPIHFAAGVIPLHICVFVRSGATTDISPFLLLRELPGAQVYLGAVCDAGGRIQECVEIWVQALELRDLVFSGYEERLTNYALDQRWISECEATLEHLPQMVIVTGMEKNNPSPVLIKRQTGTESGPFISTEPSNWHVCKDDALLDTFGLPRYSASPFRYLHDPANSGAKTFLATSSDAQANAHVQDLDRLKASAEVAAVFNPKAGLIRVARYLPLGLEEYLQVLEGSSWQTPGPVMGEVFREGVYANLQAWSGSAKAMPFLLHGTATLPERLTEVFFLKISALLSMFKEVRSYVQAHQLPMLNLSPASFSLSLQEVDEHFPALWQARCVLVKTGQAHPFKIKSTEQRYFIRLGKIEPSPFLPEGLGAHSFGIGSVRRRNVLAETDGTVLEGTLVAEDYLRLDQNDLLWFKLPISDQRVEFYAHVYTAEALGPREVRFRTVPTKLPESVVAVLKSTAGFAKAPYEIWPLLSSPCDMHSLGIIAVRVLLANSKSNVPVIVDDVLGLARYFGKEPEKEEQLLPKLKALLAREPKLLDLLSPQSLLDLNWTPEKARSQIQLELWFEAMIWLLRLFPGAGSQSYCKSFGDVSPLALENVFDTPIQALENLALRLRSVLVPTTLANEEIASIILEQIAKA